MASFPEYTVQQLADATGNEYSSYSPFAQVALEQALFLFKMATCLSSWPDNADDAQLASYAVMEAAQAIYYSQINSAASASPFSSETIGSYSYSKLASSAANGQPTNLFWLDMAVQRLGVCDFATAGGVGGGSIYIFDEDLPSWVDSEDHPHVMGPMNDWRYYGAPPTQ